MMSDLSHFDILGLVLFTALSISLFVVPITSVLAHRWGAIDHPKERSSHKVPMPRLGGLGMSVGLFLSCILFLPPSDFFFAFLAGLSVVVLVGVVDDVKDIGPIWKLAGQILAAATFVQLGGGALDNLGNFLGGEVIELDGAAVPVTMLCIVAGMNAFNMSDGLDGLAVGLAALAALFLAYFSWDAAEPELLIVCMALFGAVLGFLRYNSYPAKVFMGDCGSLVLGYVLSVLVVSGGQRDESGGGVVTWVMVIALPLLDMLVVMARRIWHRNSPLAADRTHLHHRLLALGLLPPVVVAILYAGTAGFGMVALLMREQPDVYQFLAMLAFGALVFGVVGGLQRAGYKYHRGDLGRFSSMRQWPSSKRFSDTLSNHAISVSVLLLCLLCLPAIFLPLSGMNRNEAMALLMLAGVLAFYSWQPAPHSPKGMLHGAVYVTVFALFFLYNIAVAGEALWAMGYLVTISLIAALWVATKLYFRKNTAVLQTSSFELLMLFVAWFVPFVLLPEIGLPPRIVDAGRWACLQALPFLLAAKIYFRIQPRGNIWVVGIMTSALVIIALRNLIG